MAHDGCAQARASEAGSARSLLTGRRLAARDRFGDSGIVRIQAGCERVPVLQPCSPSSRLREAACASSAPGAPDPQFAASNSERLMDFSASSWPYPSTSSRSTMLAPRRWLGTPAVPTRPRRSRRARRSRWCASYSAAPSTSSPSPTARGAARSLAGGARSVFTALAQTASSRCRWPSFAGSRPGHPSGGPAAPRRTSQRRVTTGVNDATRHPFNVWASRAV